MEALGELLHWRAERLGVGGIAIEDVYAEGLAIFGGEQSDNDLLLAFLAITIIAIGPKLVLLGFQVRG